ncbi:hypothetical protein J5Y03_05745 [Bacillus sp. RG28]|uniref:Uncharacterized protein n=1 Tax=Gottfriedia endophytica TaxID=2820819 RepID=A0A940NI12_9BACI|nr:hypothetical protein [Gottfriedia endophytica]MBP0724690.1 hypothetical protein [Gottfriedia endophytica]
MYRKKDLSKLIEEELFRFANSNVNIGEWKTLQHGISIIPVYTIILGVLESKIKGGNMNLIPSVFIVSKGKKLFIQTIEKDTYYYEKVIDVAPQILDELQRSF